MNLRRQLLAFLVAAFALIGVLVCLTGASMMPYPRAYSIATSSIAAGSTTATLTLDLTPNLSTDRFQVSAYPDTVGEKYAGHGDAYGFLEGGTTAEIGITSATYVDLTVVMWVWRE